MSDLRRDPVSGSWVIISPEQEPGIKIESFEWEGIPPRECPFCPGNERDTPHPILVYANGTDASGPEPWKVRVIPNRVPVLRADETLEREGIGMFDRITGVGAHEIVVESPVHSQRLKDFSNDQIKLVLSAWKDRLNDLFQDSRLRYVAIFRNEGRRAGARIDHPHSQVTATPMIPIGIRIELTGARDYFEYKERCVFCDLIDQEREERHRLVDQNRGFVAFCPFASRFPFETWILPRRHSHHYGTIREEEISDLASILSNVTRTIAGALLNPDLHISLKTSPNPAPRRGKWTTLEEDFHWHLEVIPKIGRGTGYETATGMYVNPTTPEEAASFLRSTLVKLEIESRRETARRTNGS